MLIKQVEAINELVVVSNKFNLVINVISCWFVYPTIALSRSPSCIFVIISGIVIEVHVQSIKDNVTTTRRRFVICDDDDNKFN